MKEFATLNKLLEPCPFCGGEAHLVHDTYKNSYGVVCDNKDHLCRAAIWPSYGDPALAVKAWNRRKKSFRRKAHWLCFLNHHECARCGFRFGSAVVHDTDFNYCPKCGSDMRNRNGNVVFEDWDGSHKNKKPRRTKTSLTK